MHGDKQRVGVKRDKGTPDAVMCDHCETDSLHGRFSWNLKSIHADQIKCFFSLARDRAYSLEVSAETSIENSETGRITRKTALRTQRSPLTRSPSAIGAEPCQMQARLYLYVKEADPIKLSFSIKKRGPNNDRASWRRELKCLVTPSDLFKTN